MLKVPGELAGDRIERQRRVEIETVVGDATLLNGIPKGAGIVGIARSKQRQVLHGIVARRDPDGCTVSLFEREPVPAVSARRLGSRDRIEAPRFLPRFRVETGDEV